MLNAGLAVPLSDEEVTELSERARRSRGAVLTATTVAASGHPGGSFSSMEVFTALYGCARVRPLEPRWEGRDRIVVSHGHTSPGAYTALALAGFFPVEQVEAHFRQAGSVFEGHVERSVPGIEWSTGNLGQGLSAGVGFALGARLTRGDWHTFVAMSDAEQHKGQVAEARRLAAKEGLGNITAVVDWNHIQISGRTDDVMPVAIAEDWRADGWRVYECDGHDVRALHGALAQAEADGVPSVVLAHTHIGHPVSFMLDDPQYHGRGLTRDEYLRAMTELDLSTDALGAAVVGRAGECGVTALPHETPAAAIRTGEPRTYAADARTDNRSAWGAALVDLAEANADVAVAVVDCDLSVSVKTDGFATARPTGFIEAGVGEHNAATVTGALSTVPGVLAFWSDFGVFGIDEVYNQQRLNDINGAGVKLVVTHCGLDVGEDGKTHQCLDYVGAWRDMFGWKAIVPADPNQTDRAVRAAAEMPGNVCVAMGRSKLPIVLDGAGEPLFGGSYRFEYGEVVWAREGDDACVLVLGGLAGEVLAAADALRGAGIAVSVGLVSCPLALPADVLVRIQRAPAVVTVEDHAVGSGLGASVAELLARAGAGVPLTRLGVSSYQSSGAAVDVLRRAGLDAVSIERAVRVAIGA